MEKVHGFIKKILFSTGIVCLSLLILPLTVAAERTTTVSGNTIPALDATRQTQEEQEGLQNFGYVEIPHTTYSIFDENNEIPIEWYANLPSSYDAREAGAVTSIKNQNPWGTCWSFSTLAALESSLLNAKLFEDIDLSEYHFINNNYNSVVDPLKGTEGDSITYNGTISQFLNAGGNVVVAYHALANWMGAVSEEAAAYPTQNPQELEKTVDSVYLNDIVHVQQVYMLNKEDDSAIKKEIMEHGAVTAAFYYSASYLNQSTGGYYANSTTASNHAVTIVGWDDNYSKDNFRTAPLADGAWLVKNSWGTWFGIDGYLWISYEDTSLQDTMCVLIGEKADNYDHNYQYDGSYMSTYLSGTDIVTAANVFEAAEGDTQELIRAVSFEMGNTNVDYSIQIYTNLTDAGIPTSGTARLSQPVSGTTTYQGYYTVKLPEAVEINSGESFAVVIEYRKAGGPRIVLETSQTWNNTEFTAGAKENQSFLRFGDAGAWRDAGAIYGGNIRIKAFTDDTDAPSYISVSGVELDINSVEMTVGDTAWLQANVLPQKANNQNVLWTSTNKSVVDVDENGKLTAKKKGTASVICTTEEGQYTAEAAITVRDAISLLPAQMELTVGEEKQLTILRNGIEQPPEEAGEFYWKADNETTACVSEEGTITGTGMGNCVVTCISKNDEEEQASMTVTIKVPFEDLRTDWWQYPFVLNVYQKGIMQGKSSDFFGTEDSLKRSEFVTLLYAYAGKPECGYRDIFTDVKKEDWFAVPVIWAYENGIVSGYGEGIFGSEDTISREQLVLMLYRYGEMLKQDMSFEQGNLTAFPDYGKVSSYAVEALDWAVYNGMISGRGDGLAPQGQTTRGECATIMTRFMER